MILDEWQLWMHPYPRMIGKKRRLNPSKVKFGRIFQDGNELVKLSDLFEARRRTPPQLKRCVVAVAKKMSGDGEITRDSISRAFAICTKSLQHKGYLKKGSQAPTKKGKARGKSKAAEKKHKGRVAEYEAMLAAVRKS